MKHKLLNGAVGLTVIASTAWIPSQKVGAVPFTSPPDNIAPSESTGGASRGGLFVPKPGESNINRRATGGASRGSLFTPKPGESNINRRATGGASRGLFSPGSRQPIGQRRATGGASRGLFSPGSRQPIGQRGATGGASRGLFSPGSRQPIRQRGATGGASRGLFSPGYRQPIRQRGATGGASRGLFSPGSRQPIGQRGATGGASRGLFSPGSRQPIGQRGATGGASRGLFSPGSRQPIRQEGVSSGASRDGRRYLNYPYTNLEQPAAILALLPQSYFGTTVAQHAEILVYVPQSQARESVFSLKDAQGNTLHEMNVPISGQAEVISIKVPTELKLEKDYQWFLALKIDGELSTRTPYVDGWIKRIRPNQEIAASMQQGDLLKQAKAFGKHGVWYDCVSALAKLKATQPNNSSLNKHWSELLESVGLEKIEKAPVVATNYGF